MKNNALRVGHDLVSPDNFLHHAEFVWEGKGELYLRQSLL